MTSEQRVAHTRTQIMALQPDLILQFFHRKGMFMSDASMIAVALQWKGPEGQQVELVGDFPNWQHPIPMREDLPGQYECHIKLRPGLYRYQFRVNQNTWICDPLALLTEKTEGFENAILVVGGMLNPAIFAPDRQHWAQWEDGRIVIHVEVPAQQKPPSHLCFRASEHSREPSAVIDVPLLPLMTRKDRTLLRAEVRRPAHSAPWTQMFFPSNPQTLFLLPPPRTPLGRSPAWLNSAVFYAIFVDRWFREQPENSSVSESASSSLPLFSPRKNSSTPSTRYGGDLEGIAKYLDYFVQLGVTGIILSPIHCSLSAHRYDSIDLNTIDPALGGESAFLRLLQAAHQRNLRVIVDISLTHVHEKHPAFQDLLLHQETSSYKNWFFVRDFPVAAGNGSTFDHYPKHPELPWLNLNSGPAREYVMKAVDQLVRWGVDGFRLDAVEEAPADFWQELRRRSRYRNPNLLLLGEFISDKPGYLAEHQGLDTITDFQHREFMLHFFAKSEISAQEFWDRQTLAHFRMGPFDPSFRLLFLDNHDTIRFCTIAGQIERLHLALAYLLLRPEPVWLTYGTELALSCGDLSAAQQEMWHERIPMPDLSFSPQTPLSTPTQRLLQQLLYWRRILPPLQSSIIRLVQAVEHGLVVERISSQSVVRAYFNVGSAPLELLPLPERAQLLVSIHAQDKTPTQMPSLSAQWYLLPVL